VNRLAPKVFQAKPTNRFLEEMEMFHTIRIRPYELGLIFHRDVFAGVLEPGDYRRFDPFGRERIETVNLRKPFLTSDHIELLAQTPALAERATLLEVLDRQRALVWIDGRFELIVGPGRYGYWTGLRKVRVEMIDATPVRFVHDDLDAIVKSISATSLLEVHDIPAESVGVLSIAGREAELIGPGRHAFWKDRGSVRLTIVNRKEQLLDVPGQDVLTADRVTVRLTIVTAFKVADAIRFVTAADDAKQSLYRDVQLAVRAAVGARTLDAFIADKVQIARELAEAVKATAAPLGLAVSTVGIKDVVLPGDMKELLNKVIEARTAAEAAVITRREETAALRHQANAAKMLAETPGLMKLREMEAIERIAAAGKLSVVIGEKNLADSLAKLVA
jgi:regulator of protease activity HflC (stomatin/prohibitin superfamily)